MQDSSDLRFPCPLLHGPCPTRSVRGVRPHNAVMVDPADNPSFAAVVCSSMIVHLDAGIEVEVLHQAFGIEDRVEVHPGAAVRGPRASNGDNAPSLIADITLGLAQVFAHAGVLIEFLQFVLTPRALIENAEAIPDSHHPLIVIRKTAAEMSEHPLPESDGLVSLVNGTEKRSKVVGCRHCGWRFRTGQLCEQAVDAAEVTLRCDRLSRVFEETLPANNLTRGVCKLLRRLCRSAPEG